MSGLAKEGNARVRFSNHVEPHRCAHQALGGNASVSLVSASGSISQTSSTAWSLAKTGSVDAGAQTIGGQLHLIGTLDVTNTGSGPATIGNILVNLQTKSGSSWVTRSSDVNDATSGAATTAYIRTTRA